MDTDIQQQTLVDCSTKIEGKDYVSHVTIDWNGMTPRDLQEIAQGRIIIKFQDTHRRLGQVPEETVTLKATDYKVGTRHSVAMTPEQALAKLSPEALLELLKSKGLA